MWFRRKSTDQKRAREIMGENFFGIEESKRFFGVNPSRWQIWRISRIPFSEEMLDACKDTHILSSVFPITIPDFYNKFGNTLFPYVSHYCKNNLNYIDHKGHLKKAVGETAWILLRKEPMFIGKSLMKIKTLSLLCKEDKVPTVLSIVYSMIGHFLKTGNRLFEKVSVLSSDVDSNCFHITVDFIDGIRLGACQYHKPNENIGLATIRT